MSKLQKTLRKFLQKFIEYLTTKYPYLYFSQEPALIKERHKNELRSNCTLNIRSPNSTASTCALSPILPPTSNNFCNVNKKQVYYLFADLKSYKVA